MVGDLPANGGVTFVRVRKAAGPLGDGHATELRTRGWEQEPVLGPYTQAVHRCKHISWPPTYSQPTGASTLDGHIHTVHSRKHIRWPPTHSPQAQAH